MSLIEAFRAFPALFVTAVTLMSLAIGSFLNVVIHRLPKMLERQWRDELAELNGQDVAAAPRYNLVVPRSACPACGHPIGALENIPLVSYLALGGKCASCKARISPRYPVVEALTGAVSGYIAWRYGFTWHTLAMLVTTTVVAVAVYEWVGLEILRRAWINVDLVSNAASLPRSDTHVVSRHPEWLMIPKALANRRHELVPA